MSDIRRVEYGPLAQSAEAIDLKSIQYGFESHMVYKVMEERNKGDSYALIIYGSDVSSVKQEMSLTPYLS